MRLMAILTIFLWITPLVLLGLISLAMIIRHQVRTYPLFFTYTVCVSLRDLILLFTRRNLDLYSWIYWTGDAILLLLGMAIIHEAFWNLIRPYCYLRLIGKQLLRIAILLLFAAGVYLFASSYDKEASRSVQLAWLAERSARLVQVGALVVVLALVSHFGLAWRHHTAGIIMGFGVAAGLQLGLYELKAHLQGINDYVFTLLTPAAYNVAAIIWSAYFLPVYKTEKPKLPFAVDLSKLDRMLGEFIKR